MLTMSHRLTGFRLGADESSEPHVQPGHSRVQAEALFNSILNFPLNATGRFKEALTTNVSPLAAFQGLSDLHVPFDQWLCLLHALLQAIGTDALLATSEDGVPLWRDGYDAHFRFNCEGRPRALVLLVFKNAGCPLTIDDLVAKAIALDEMNVVDYVDQAFLRHGAPDLVDALLPHVLAPMDAARQQAWWDAYARRMEVSGDPGLLQRSKGSVAPTGMETYARVFLKHGFRPTQNLLQSSSLDMLATYVEHGDVLARLMDNGEWLWPVSDRIERIHTMCEHAKVDDMNSAVLLDDKPYPVWTMLLNASLGPFRDGYLQPTPHNDADVDETVLQALIAAGADISRDGIARHFPEERKVEAIETVFEVLERVRRHVEEMELRAVADQTMAEAEQEAPVYVRKRM